MAGLLVLVALTPSLMGRAGFQALEQAMAARIFVLHQHGVPGEAEYIHAHGAPAPFVHPHCHAPVGPRGSETPAQLAMGGLLFGPVLCGEAASLPVPPRPAVWAKESIPPPHEARSMQPPTPPPQV